MIARLQKEGSPARMVPAAITGRAVCELAAILGAEEAARELREAADICQCAAERGEVGPLAGAEVVGKA